MIKFSQMPYERPDFEQTKKALRELTLCLQNADSYSAAKKAFREKEALMKHINTMDTLANIRHTIDTRDEFYDQEVCFLNQALPELEDNLQQWRLALTASRFRQDFEQEYGTLMFVNAEILQKTFAPELVPLMQKENDLKTRYEKLIASAQIPFEGGVYTLSQLSPFKNDGDDSRRLAAWKAEGAWYKEQQEALDEIYDELVKVRSAMGRMLGYENYIPLGYFRMNRNCYDRHDVERFRKAVVAYVVPLADRICKAQAERIGKPYPMNFADNALMFRSGNPLPAKKGEELLEIGRKFYRELSGETGSFFDMMLDRGLMDVLSTKGKAGGGYCTSIEDYGVPFIFANFNGTQGDVEVITHEAGHAFAAYTNRDRVPSEYIWPSLEACEVHSMSMEFFSWPWAKDFFGKDAEKFKYSHLASALTFIPYGTMVDHFQHVIYEKPELSPEERHKVWKELLGTYMPWLKLDGEIPFYSEGEGWQRQHHIYEDPFYYIDYCLAQTVSLQFWAKIQKDIKNAWSYYMAYTSQGGSAVFTKLLENAGLRSPFDENCLKSVCQEANTWLESFDLGGLA